MSSYTITLKRCSEVYGKDEILSWFTDYNIMETLTMKQADELMRPIDLFGNYAWSPEKLAELIFDHYYLREIAYETPEMFRHYVNVKMKEIMPKYLLLLWSASVKYDPMKNETFNFVENYSGNKTDSRNSSSNQKSVTDGTSESNSSSNSSGLTINNDTPQGQISKENILNGSYASSTSANESENQIQDTTESSSSASVSNNDSTNGTSEDSYEKTRSGYDLKMTNADKILNYRKSIENYNLQIIEELNPLFFALY